MILDLEKSEQQNKAYDYAVFLLNLRLRTEGELREKMRSKKYESGIMDEVIKRLKDLHYIDDQRFAEVYVENLKKYKSWGYFGIKKKLMEKRLPSSIIESVLAEGMAEEEELEIAKKFLKKQKLLTESSKSKTLNHQGFRAQTARKLAAKGFRSNIIFRVVND